MEETFRELNVTDLSRLVLEVCMKLLPVKKAGVHWGFS